MDQYIKMDIRFKEGKSAVLSTCIRNERIKLSGGGLQGASFASFFIRELLPNELMASEVLAKSGIAFDASLWTQNSGDSPEVFIYEIVFGDEEYVGVPPWNK